MVVCWLFTFATESLTGSCKLLLMFSIKRQHHTSPWKDQNSKLEVQFLLNPYYFCAIVKLESHKSGTFCTAFAASCMFWCHILIIIQLKYFHLKWGFNILWGIVRDLRMAKPCPAHHWEDSWRCCIYRLNTNRKWRRTFSWPLDLISSRT